MSRTTLAWVSSVMLIAFSVLIVALTATYTSEDAPDNESLGMVSGYRIGVFYDRAGDVICYYRAEQLECLPRAQTAYTPDQAEGLSR